MFQSQSGTSDSQTPASVEPRFVRALSDAFGHGHAVDGVRLFLQAVERGALPNDGDLRTAAKEVLGQTLFQHLLAACSIFPCPYCSNGFLQCGACMGTGRAEGTFACGACRTLGVTKCDFCAGSGFASYSFFPKDLEDLIAMTRVQQATRRLDLAMTGADQAAPVARGVAIRPLLNQYLDLLRAHAVFQNALDFARGRNGSRHECARLAAKCWVGLARTEIELCRVLTKMLAQKPSRPDESANGDYLQERVRLLGEERSQLMSRARDRVQHIRERRTHEVAGSDESGE